MMASIKFRQLNCNRRVATTCGIEINKNEIHLLQEPRCNKDGLVDVKVKRKCFSKNNARAAIYAPNLIDASIMPVNNLITKDCSVALLENPALGKPVLIASHTGLQAHLSQQAFPPKNLSVDH